MQKDTEKLKEICGDIDAIVDVASNVITEMSIQIDTVKRAFELSEIYDLPKGYLEKTIINMCQDTIFQLNQIVDELEAIMFSIS
jgi:hypothetical protein